jgi:hypothetical protein
MSANAAPAASPPDRQATCGGAFDQARICARCVRRIRVHGSGTSRVLAFTTQADQRDRVLAEVMASIPTIRRFLAPRPVMRGDSGRRWADLARFDAFFSALAP